QELTWLLTIDRDACVAADRDIGLDAARPDADRRAFVVDADAGSAGVDTEALAIFDDDGAVARLQPDAGAGRLDTVIDVILFDDAGAFRPVALGRRRVVSAS